MFRSSFGILYMISQDYNCWKWIFKVRNPIEKDKEDRKYPVLGIGTIDFDYVLKVLFSYQK